MRLFTRRFEQPLTDLFNDLAQLLVGGAETLSRILSQPARDRSHSAPKLHEHATRAGQLSHRVTNRLADSLISPFEADALHDLALAMADVLDAMESTAELMVHGRRPTAPDTLLETAQVIERMAELDNYYREIRRLKKHGDRLIQTTMTDLYDRGGTAVDLLRERDLIQAVGRVLTLLELVGRLMDVLRVKAP
jgi:uncharacterized protein Yka (UPF0111/DUF47 family)